MKSKYLLKRHDGAWRDILARGVPVFATDGGIREYVGTCIDITERKRAESELHRLYAEQQAIFDAVPALVWFKDTKNKHIRVNRGRRGHRQAYRRDRGPRRRRDRSGRGRALLPGRPGGDSFRAAQARHHGTVQDRQR